MAVKKSGLGRGLDSLFSENSTDNEGAVRLNLLDEQFIDLDFEQLMHDARAELDAFDGSIDAIIAATKRTERNFFIM